VNPWTEYPFLRRAGIWPLRALWIVIRRKWLYSRAARAREKRRMKRRANGIEWW